MNRREKLLYHQIHPAKLAADWSFGILSLVPFWNHQPALGIVLAFLPSLLTSYLIIKLTDLSSLKNSRFGRYMAAHMSGLLQIVRLAGFLLTVIGAWQHDALIIALGFALILLAWLNGVFISRLRRNMPLPRSMRHSAPRNLPR